MVTEKLLCGLGVTRNVLDTIINYVRLDRIKAKKRLHEFLRRHLQWKIHDLVNEGSITTGFNRMEFSSSRNITPMNKLNLIILTAWMGNLIEMKYYFLGDHGWGREDHVHRTESDGAWYKKGNGWVYKLWVKKSDRTDFVKI